VRKTSTVIITCILLLPTFSVLRLVLLGASVSSSDSGWVQTYGGTDDDWACSIIKTNDGGYALAGASCSYSASGLADVYLVKIDSSGIMQWNKTYGGMYDEGADCVIQTSDGGYVLAGYAASSVSDDVYLIKTDSSGNMQWSKYWRGKGDDFAHSVVQTSDGGYALAGWTDSFGDGLFDDFYLIKTDSSGNTQWFKTYGGPVEEQAYSVIQTGDGGYVLAGYTRSFGAGGHDFWLVKTDSAGSPLWNKTYGGAYYDEAYYAVQTSDGGYALAGTIYTFGGIYADESYGYLVKTDSLGNMEWSKTYGGTDYVAVHSVVQTNDSGFAVAGRTRYFGAGNSDAWLVKTDSLGNTQWRKTYGGTQGEWVNSVIQTDDGGYALAGYTDSFGAGGEDVYLVKTESSPSPVHDIVLIDVQPSKTVVGESSVCGLNVTVVNRGDFNEAFNVTAWALVAPPAKSIENASVVNLPPDEIRTVMISWNTTGWAYGNYSISVHAEPVSGETNTANNAYTDGWVVVTIPGDVDGDSVVDILDIVRITSIYLVSEGDWRYAANADIDGSGFIDILDVVICTSHYKQEWT